MAISIISAKQFARNLKATIQASGRLGFTDETAKAFDFASGKFAKFGKDEESGNLYLIIIDKADEDAFQIKMSSNYYYVPTRQMFDMLGFDYENNNIIFDLIPQPSHDADLAGQVYRMKPRINPRKDKKSDDIEV